MNQFYQNQRVPAAQPGEDNNAPGVRVHYYFASGRPSILFRLQLMATLREGDEWQMWEFIPV